MPNKLILPLAVFLMIIVYGCATTTAAFDSGIKKINEFEEKFGNFDGDKNYGLVAVIKDFLLQSLTEVIEETIKECIGVSDKLWGNFDKSYPEEYPETWEDL